MTDSLPGFRYHPDSIATGSVAASDSTCVACGAARGYVYTGPAHSERELDDPICPWCIADGRAHRALGVTFVDEFGIGGHSGRWGRVAASVARELVERTPCFLGWQQEQWFTCCGDAAAFLGRAGKRELEAAGPETIACVREELGFDEPTWERYFDELDADGSPTAYLFRCLHCGRIGGYSDCH